MLHTYNINTIYKLACVGLDKKQTAACFLFFSRKFCPTCGKEAGMIYFTADLHLGHKSVIGMCGRPFADVEEMNEALVSAWNDRVHKNDDVYILGDFSFRSEVSPAEYLKRLKGRKHLIIGNHDRTWINKVDLSEYFEDWSSLLVKNFGRGKTTLCHFPMLAFEGKYLIHGHMHNNTKRAYWSYLRTMDNAFNAGVDINGFVPVSFDELVANNADFKMNN